jgi:hypothetical protein
MNVIAEAGAAHNPTAMRMAACVFMRLRRLQQAFWTVEIKTLLAGFSTDRSYGWHFRLQDKRSNTLLGRLP